MGLLQGDGGQDRTDSSVSSIDQRRSSPREEPPWLRDQRRAPRSVRSPPPPGANTIHPNRATASAYSNKKRRQRSPPETNHNNPFDSPMPVSRNPSPSVDGLCSPSSRPKSQPVKSLWSTPSPRPPPSHWTHAARNATSNNPFDSPKEVQNNPTRTNPFESPSPIKGTAGNNPFESPSNSSSSPPLQQKIIDTKHGTRHLSKIPNDPYDTSLRIDGKASDLSEDSTPLPEVRVSIHTRQSTSTMSTKQIGSASTDSLKQIMDVTEETVDEEEESDEVMQGSYGDERWLDEPHPRVPKMHQEERAQVFLHQEHYPDLQLSTPSHTYFSPGSQQTDIQSNRSFTSDPDDGTNTTATPSEKALRAAERLKKSFEQRRRERAAGTRTPGAIHEEEGQLPQQDHNDPTLDYIRTEESQTRILRGVAAKRRAGADARNSKAITAEIDGRQTEQLLSQQSRVVESNISKNKSAETENGEEQQQQQQQQQQQRTEAPSNIDFTLHDLCDEALGTEDLAWRNAIYLLSVKPFLGRQVESECRMTPLHVACLGQQPPPVWITRGLLYAAPETCSQTDTGGRLPLHLIVATSANIDTIRLLVEEYPPGVAHRDDRGFTPLQLLLKRSDSDGLTLEHVRLLLGQQADGAQRQRNRNSRFLFRSGDHLKNDWILRELESVAEERERKHESVFREYPDDIRRALTKLSQWKRRQVNKQASNNTNGNAIKRSDAEIQFLRSREADFETPASIPTPTGQLLPLHLLVRRNIPTDAALSHNIHSTKRATLVDLLRVLIAAYPRGLVEVDANGKTPVITAMLQSDTSPSNEVIELLLGLRTHGFEGRNGMERPALIATGDTFQMPLHVAAEELLSNFPLLRTICEAYPDARTVQDVRGRTPLHLALQNYRSVPVNEATLELLFVESVARMKDNDGKTPLDLLIENPKCVIQEPSQDCSSTILQEFFDVSIERPRNRREVEDFFRDFQCFPPWLRRQACAARFVQTMLVEEIASPFTTFRILGSGIVLCLLLLSLRRMLHLDPDYTFLLYYLATYHFIMQIVHWGIAIYMGEFFRSCISNIWRWIDLATVVFSFWCAIYVSLNVVDVGDGAETILVPLGALATISCWLSLLGFFVEWSCGLAVFIGSAVKLLSILVWPMCVAFSGFFAASQVLFTLYDCIDGEICNLSGAYELVYLTAMGQPVLTGDYVWSMETFVTVLIVTIVCFWWVMSVIATIVTEANRLDRRELSLSWYWEPKASLTVMTSAGYKNAKFKETSSLVEQYCDKSERYWHILSSALRGQKSDVHWDACCLRSTRMMIFTGFVASFVVPIWFVLGLLTLGLLWPPQIRRWIFCPRPASSTNLRRKYRRRLNGEDEGELTKAKLSKLRNDLMDLKAMTQTQHLRIQQDLGSIKEVILQATMNKDANY